MTISEGKVKNREVELRFEKTFVCEMTGSGEVGRRVKAQALVIVSDALTTSAERSNPARAALLPQGFWAH